MNSVRLLVVNDFSMVPFQVRNIAMALPYDTVTYAGHRFHGIGSDGIIEPCLWADLAHVIKDPPDRRASFFRLGTDFTPPTTYIHADLDMGRWAGVLYLNRDDQKYGGTAFWRHKQTGWTELPLFLTEGALQMLEEDGMDESKWELESVVGMAFNRFITYPTKLFHSRYPNHIPAKTPEDGRLVWCCFYDEV